MNKWFLYFAATILCLGMTWIISAITGWDFWHVLLVIVMLDGFHTDIWGTTNERKNHEGS
jgi:hypothetical protein